MNDSGHSRLSYQATEYKSRRMFGVATIFLLLSFVLFLCQLINFGVFNTSASGSDSLPVSIRAISQADYGRDDQALSIPPISGNILRQIIMDMPSTDSPENRISTLEVELSLPVPTMTPDYLFPTTPAPTQTIEPTPSRSPSNTPIPTISKTGTPPPIVVPTKSFTPSKTSVPTRTFTFTYTATSTRTPSPTFTSTPRPTATLTSTATPTATVMTLTDTPTPTSTESVPTDTPTPTPTSTESVPTDTPTPTATEELPTDTPTPTPTPTLETSCALTSGGIFLSGSNIEMTITNNGDTVAAITGINVNWPDEPESQTVSQITFNGVTIVNADDPQPPSDYPSEKNWAGTQSDLELAASDSKPLILLFSEDLQASGYSITITFDNGCTLSENN